MIFSSPSMPSCIIECVIIFLTIISVTLTPLVIVAVTSAHGIHGDWATMETKNADIVITVLNLVSLALLDMLQLILYWFSEWGKVSLTCRYVSHLWWQKNKFIERNLFSSARLHCFRIGRTKIGQYSILQSFEGKYL
jgi:hypothetical protein